jgi:hypothetical protein
MFHQKITVHELTPNCNFYFLHQTDPGVPIVYAGLGALMLTACISYLSHSQV